VLEAAKENRGTEVSPKTGQLRLSEIFSASDWVIAGWPVFGHKTGPIFWEAHNRKRSRDLQTKATEKLAGFVTKGINQGYGGPDSGGEERAYFRPSGKPGRALPEET
jgi:hypothetical protein